MADIIFQILHFPFLVTAHKQCQLMLYGNLQLPQTLHHIKYTHRRAFIVLCSPPNQEIIFEHGFKGFISPLISHRNYIQMVPETDHMIPILILLPYAAHTVSVILRMKSKLPPHGQHFFQAIPARFPERSLLPFLRAGYTGNPHKTDNISNHFLPVLFKPPADLIIQFSIHTDSPSYGLVY